MSTDQYLPLESAKLQPRIIVLGVGGAGGNAVNNMIKSNLEGVECLVANTDAQALALSLAERKIQLGLSLTQGLGAGARPEIGRAAAEEGLDEISEHLHGCHMVFLTAGMGGGTGTGATPVLARAAREQGILTVGVVTKPFHFEGVQRMRIADAGIEELEQVVDTLIVIPNQNLFRVANEHTTFADAFKMADDVLYSGVRGVTDLMVMPGLINLDFADIRTVMSEMGKAMMGAGEAEGDNRAVAAAEAAISNPLLDDLSMKGARGVLINITGGSDMTLYEVDEAANRIRDEVDPNANIIFGSTFDDTLQGQVRVSVFATGIASEVASEPQPITIRVVSQDGRITKPAVTRPAQKETPPRPMRPAAAVEPKPVAPPKPVDEKPAPSSSPAAAEPTGVRKEPHFGPVQPSLAVESAAKPPAPTIAHEVARKAALDRPEPPLLAAERATDRQDRPARAPSLTAHADIDEPHTVEEAPVKAPAAAAQPAVEASSEGPATREPSEEDLLEIPAFLRRQAN